MIPFVEPLVPRYGEPELVAPQIRRVLAENPSKYTYLGTGTYIVGHGSVAVIDPGPDLDSHFDALGRALDGERVVAILITHCHSDHSPLARRLAAATGAVTYGFGPAVVAPPEPDDDEVVFPSAPVESEPPVTEVGHSESVDVDFVPDVAVVDGDVISGPGWTFEVLHTPGHTSNHACFALAESAAMFTGDHVMGWSTSVIGPPDGDMTAYLNSLQRLEHRTDSTYWPTHGGPIHDPRAFVAALRRHRLERDARVLELVRSGVADVPTMVAVLYAEVRPELHRAAGRSVLAHLIALVQRGLVTTDDGRPRLNARFRPVLEPHPT